MMNKKTSLLISRRDLLQKGFAGAVALTFLPLDGITKSFAQGISGAPTSLPFLKEGVPQFYLKVLSDKAPLQFAAQQMAQIVPELTGNKTAPPASAWTLKIDIANDVLSRQKISRENLGDDGYLIVKEDDGLLVTGYTGRAVLYGIFALLESATGFAWVRPLIGSAPLEPIRDASLQLSFPLISKPAFVERGLSLSVMQWKTDNDHMLNWLERNGLNMNAMNTVLFQSLWDKSVDEASDLKAHCENREKRGLPLEIHGHSFGFLISPEEFGKTHPEYFSLIDGKRKVSTRNSQLCLSNSAVLDLIVQRFEKMLDAQPDLQTLGLGPNDGAGGWCQCEFCNAMDSPTDMHQPFTHGERSYSTRYIKFANQVAQRLSKKYPNAHIHVYAYTNYIAPPDCEVDPALEVEFCAMYRCTVHALNDPNCPKNSAFNRFLQGWLTKTKNIYIRDYFIMMGSGAARAMPTSLYTLQKDIRYYQSQQLLGLVPEMIPDGPNGANVASGEPYASWLQPPSRYTDVWNTGWLVYYGMARLLWNPAQKAENIIAQACDSYYGAASEQMSQYHQILQENWYQSGHPGVAPPANQITTFSENVQSGPYCLGWGYAPRITWQANHLFNVQPDGKTTKAELTKLAQLLLDAREIARKKMLPVLRDRIETDVQNFQEWALSQSYEIDFRFGQTKVKFMSTTRETTTE
jgi:hypothetical protein